ncbi:MAK10-like protein, partial [Tanacetum coccineum]
MALLMGPPSSGKTTFLLALAGRLDRVNGVQYEKRYCTCGSVTTTTTVVVAASAAAPTAAATTTAATVATASPATTATTATTTTTTATTTTAATTTTQTILVLLHEKQPVVPGTKRRRTEPNVFQQANKRTTTHLKMNGVRREDIARMQEIELVLSRMRVCAARLKRKINTAHVHLYVGVYITTAIESIIMEYLVNISKRRAFWSLNEDILKITILMTNTPYPSRKIRRIRACTHQRRQRNKAQYAVSREDQYAVLEIWNEYNILEDIKCGPYSKKSPIPHYSEVEEAETMAETMEQYMSKSRTDYGSGVSRPKIDNKDQFKLKGQFLKELRENTFSSSDHEDENKHMEKVFKIVDLFHVPNITVDQLMLRVFPISLTGAASRWLRNESTGSIKTWEDLKTKFLNKYCPPDRTAKKMEEINNFQQELDETLYQT